MDLYIVYQFGTENVLGAYWGDSLSAVMNAYKTDGINPDNASSFGATTAQAAMYHGPDFAGRRLYKIDFVSERGEFADETVYVAADTIKDASRFADEFTNGRHRFICLIPPGTELDFVEPGWNQ